MLKVRFPRLMASALLIGTCVPAIVGTQIASAVPAANTDNVTICHRTASVTNPYVLITVDQRSVGNANSKHGGGVHDHWATSVYTTKPNPNVFDPSKTYPANDKKWGDIIAFKDVSGNNLTGNAAQVAGLNNTGIGAQIFNGTGAYAGLCRKMNARDYYDVQVAAGVNPTDALAELQELESVEFASAQTACGGSFTGCNPSTLGTPTPTTVAGTPTTVAGTATTVAGTPTTVAGVTLAAGKGALTVKIWVDKDRNGKQASSEKNLKDITVKISGPNGVTKTAKTSSTGEASFLDLDPGSWSVVSTLSIDGYEKVYDSDGTVNWKSTETVVAGQVAAAAFAAATVENVSSSELPATGSSSTLMAMIAGLLLVMGVAMTAVRKRRSL